MTTPTRTERSETGCVTCVVGEEERKLRALGSEGSWNKSYEVSPTMREERSNGWRVLRKGGRVHLMGNDFAY